MTLKKAILLTFLLPMLAYGAPVPFAHEQSDIPADPAVRWGKLENGVRFALMRNQEPPTRLSMRLHIAAGSLNEEDDQRGLAHFLEHMAFNGTTHFKPADLITFLQNSGISFGAHVNASTSFDQTIYMLDLPRNDEKLIDSCLSVLADWGTGMTLQAQEIEKERGVVLSEKRDRDSVELRLMEQQLLDTMPAARISRRLPIGTEEVISGAPRERFEAFYKGNYSTDRMTVVIVGDFDLDVMEGKVRALFGPLPASDSRAEDPDLGKLTELGMFFRNYHDNEVKALSVDIGTIRPFVIRPDTKAKRIEDLPLAVANRILSRRFEILAKKENAPIINGSASRYDLVNFVESTQISTTVDGERWQEALTLTENELRKAVEYGFTQEELDEVKADLLRAVEDAVKSKSTRQSNGLAGAIVGTLNAKQVFTTPETNLEIVKEALSGITIEKCHAALKEAWAPNDRIVSVTSREPIEGGTTVIRAAYEKAAASAVEADARVETSGFAYQKVGAPGSIVSEKEVKDLGITQLVLSNNIRVNLKPTDFEKNTIRLTARFGGGRLELPKGKPGLDAVTAVIFNAGGLEAHSDDDLQRIFAGKKVGVGLGVGDDAFVLSGRTTPSDLKDELLLLCAQIEHPGYREEALRQLRKALPSMAVQMRTTAEGVLGSKGERLLHGDDSRFGILDPMQLVEYSTGNVKEWLTPSLREAAMEVSVVGDFEVLKIKPLLLETIGALAKRQAAKPDYLEERKVPVVAPGSHAIPYESKIPRALNIVVWPTADKTDISRARRLEILAKILGDRLRVKIREELGDAYSPRADSQVSDTFKDFGFLVCFSSGEPVKSERIVSVIDELAADLAAKGATQDEFDRAIRPVLAGLPEQLRNNGYWLGAVLAASQERPEHLDWARTIVTDHESITLDQINKLAREYLGAEKRAAIIISSGAADKENPVDLKSATPAKKPS